MMRLIYKIRRPLETDTKWFVFSLRSAHLIVIGAFGWRVLLRRYGPPWWQALNRVELWKYHFRRSWP